jgi:2-(1,2-epoxy-1,2-dihydrophenyl)acetyl-CoA isomerase
MDIGQRDSGEIGPVGYATAGAVSTITLLQPALTRSAKETLLVRLHEAADDNAVRAVVLTGSGRVFCAGQDLGEHASALDFDADHAFDTLETHYHPIVIALSSMPKPVVAAINGTAAGAGISLALACDVRVAADTARFATAFTGIGLSFDSGLSANLARAVGAARASELIMLGEPFTADQALAWGLVGRVAPAAELSGTAAALAAKLAAGPTQAYAAAKAALAAAFAPQLAAVLPAEAQAQSRLGMTADHRDAVRAFLNKTAPTFTGRR